jgi:hypothetical protein
MDETFQLERTILSEKESNAGSESSDESAQTDNSSPGISEKDLENVVVNCLRNMIDGRLGEVDKVIPELAKHSKDALEIVDRIAVDPSTHPQLNEVPQPVLAGFIREFRGKLT